jgi:hypothetical protein
MAAVTTVSVFLALETAHGEIAAEASVGKAKGASQ